nr:MAG TPA: Minor capsid component [Caudoviricetes sp.]
MNKKKKEQILVGKPLIPNAGVRTWYTKELNDLVAQMDERTRREVLEIFRTVAAKGGSVESQERILLSKLERYYVDLFKRKAKELGQAMVSKQNRSVSAALRASIAGFVGQQAFVPVKTLKLSGEVLKDFKGSVNENVNLIRSLQSEYFTRIKGAVYRAIIDGQGSGYLRDELRKYGAKGKRRARNIARDQTHKAYEALSRARMKEAGLRFWQWEHGGGTKTVRHYHILDVSKGGLNHSVHKIGEKAYDKTKGIEREILPGELPFCTCRMRPVIKFD